MSYTKDPIIISNPSEKLLEAIKSQKERKRSQLEKLRKMKPEDFSCRIILKWTILFLFPSRNIKGANKNLSVQEYRSKLFSYMFDSYMESHHMSGFLNTPIIIEGEGYKQFMHIISRSKHQSIVDLIKDDVLEGWGK